MLTGGGTHTDGTPRPFRESLWGTPGLVDALCRIGENGSAQARVFAGMCLKEMLKGACPWRLYWSTSTRWSRSLPLAMGALKFPSLAGMGYKRARELIEMPGFPPCINSMLCSPLEEERLSGTLILGELIGEGGEVTACMLAYTSDAMAGMLAWIRYVQGAPPYSNIRPPCCLPRSSSPLSLSPDPSLPPLSKQSVDIHI